MTGHTQLECDSDLARIERKKNNKEFDVSADFVKIIKEAKLGTDKYNVKYVLKKYSSIRPGKKIGDPCVIDIRSLKYSSSNTLNYKLCFDDWWKDHPQCQNRSVINMTSGPLYLAPIPLQTRKYRDLLSLQNIIPKDPQGRLGT